MNNPSHITDLIGSVFIDPTEISHVIRDVTRIDELLYSHEATNVTFIQWKQMCKTAASILFQTI